MSKLINLILIFLAFAFASCERNDMEEEQLDLFNKKSSMKEAITVVGQNDPLLDPMAVQNAVDTHDKVILSGIFDFGTDELVGGVDINRSNVVLQGPATINNGAKFNNFENLGGVNYPLSIQAPGVEIRNLDISNGTNGIIVHVEDPGKPVIIEDNNIETYEGAVAVSSTSCGIKVINNDLKAYYGYFGHWTSGSTEIVKNNISGGGECVWIWNFDHRLDIVNNTMNDSYWEAIWIAAWQVTEETGPEWGDNSPVNIIGNTINIDSYDAAGIMIGSSAHGINNVLVKQNTLVGVAGYGGLMKQPYGHNNKFIDNDLTGLTTYSPQIWTCGGHSNHYKNNKLGKVESFTVAGWGSALRDAATLITTVNWHYKDNWANTPDPVNYGNHYIQNDYVETEVPGWSDDPESVGAVVLIDFLQRFSVNFETSEVPFFMENFVNEKKFPANTDLCTQILDLSNLEGNDLVKGSNQIAGWMSCEAQAKKSTYQMMRNRYEKLGHFVGKKQMKRMNEKKKKLDNLK